MVPAISSPACPLVWNLADENQPISFLIHDGDTKFSASFDSVFVSEGIELVRTPFRAPKANAVAERWLRSVCEESLDYLLILNQRYLIRMLT